MTPLQTDPTPWWRYRIMWLVVGGPVVVVVAAIATIVIAVRGADPELHTVNNVPEVHGTSLKIPASQHPPARPAPKP